MFEWSWPKLIWVINTVYIYILYTLHIFESVRKLFLLPLAEIGGLVGGLEVENQDFKIMNTTSLLFRDYERFFLAVHYSMFTAHASYMYFQGVLLCIMPLFIQPEPSLTPVVLRSWNKGQAGAHKESVAALLCIWLLVGSLYESSASFEGVKLGTLADSKWIWYDSKSDGSVLIWPELWCYIHTMQDMFRCRAKHPNCVHCNTKGHKCHQSDCSALWSLFLGWV